MDSLLGLDSSHADRLTKILDNRDKAQFLFFRLIGPRLQKRLNSMFQLESVPPVFIHGNPHIDNFARTLTGAGMVDFDRSRLGPYVWDILRFLSSLHLRKDSPGKSFLSKKVLDYFFDGYHNHFDNSDLHYEIPFFIKTIIPKKHELTCMAYAEKEGKWVKRLRKNPLRKDDKKALEIFKLYLESRNEERLLRIFEISEIGTSVGSLGKTHYIYHLVPTKGEESRDHILIDIKETYTEEDDNWFKNPTEHHGLRMIKASNLYAPGVEQRLGHCTYKNVQFWGREIPIFNTKIKDALNEIEQRDLAYCVGTQLGRGHRRSCHDSNPKKLLKHFTENWEGLVTSSEAISEEVKAGFTLFEKTKEIEDNLKQKTS